MTNLRRKWFRIGPSRARCVGRVLKARSPVSYARPLRIEPLEDRRLLAVLTVTTTADNYNFGDGQLTLREAIAMSNPAGGDTINFAPSLTSGGPTTINLSNHGQ